DVDIMEEPVISKKLVWLVVIHNVEVDFAVIVEVQPGGRSCCVVGSSRKRRGSGRASHPDFLKLSIDVLEQEISHIGICDEQIQITVIIGVCPSCRSVVARNMSEAGRIRDVYKFAMSIVVQQQERIVSREKDVLIAIL